MKVSLFKFGILADLARWKIHVYMIYLSYGATYGLYDIPYSVTSQRYSFNIPYHTLASSIINHI